MPGLAEPNAALTRAGFETALRGAGWGERRIHRALVTVHAVEQRVQLTLRVTERVRLALPYVMASAFVAVFLNSIGAGAVAFLGWYVGAAVGRHVLRGE